MPLSHTPAANRNRPARSAATRRLGTVCFLLLATAPAAAQVGFDRPGGDYTHFVVRSGDPAVCASGCDRDPQCRAWSFVYPIPGAPHAVCWLKSEVKRWKKNPCCVSGVKGAGVVAPRNPAFEFSVDRHGGDYHSFDLAPDPTGQACAIACRADARCRDWTYVRPGYGAAAARCFLKDRLRPPRRAPCCISGVVR